jgi:hypothetical protein
MFPLVSTKSSQSAPLSIFVLFCFLRPLRHLSAFSAVKNTVAKHCRAVDGFHTSAVLRENGIEPALAGG